jgi:putative SOS response-associated peptidase YedK
LDLPFSKVLDVLREPEHISHGMGTSLSGVDQLAGEYQEIKKVSWKIMPPTRQTTSRGQAQARTKKVTDQKPFRRACRAFPTASDALLPPMATCEH